MAFWLFVQYLGDHFPELGVLVCLIAFGAGIAVVSLPDRLSKRQEVREAVLGGPGQEYASAYLPGDPAAVGEEHRILARALRGDEGADH